MVVSIPYCFACDRFYFDIVEVSCVSVVDVAKKKQFEFDIVSNCWCESVAEFTISFLLVAARIVNCINFGIKFNVISCLFEIILKKRR